MELIAHTQENLIEWKNENGESGLSVLITIIARLLSDIPDSAASKVGYVLFVSGSLFAYWKAIDRKSSHHFSVPTGKYSRPIAHCCIEQT